MNKKIYTLFILYFIVVLLHYFAPFFVSQIFIFTLLVLFYRSNDISYWYALFTFIMYSPGYLLTSADPLHQSFYLFHPVFNLQFMLFLIFVVKYLSTNIRIRILRTNVVFFVYSLFLVVVTLSFTY